MGTISEFSGTIRIGAVTAKSMISVDNRDPELTNHAALQQLAQEQQRLMAQCCGLGARVAGVARVMAAADYPQAIATLTTLPPLSTALQALQKTSQLYSTLNQLLVAFTDRGVVITPRLSVPNHGSLDLLVRFPLAPKKVNFAIALRSKGNSRVTYHEGKDALYLRRPGSGSKRWLPDHLQRLPLQEAWLRSHRIDLFGTSSKDKNRPLIKLLVLTGNTTLGVHQDYLYMPVDDAPVNAAPASSATPKTQLHRRVLLIRRRSSVYVLEEQQLIALIGRWLF